MEKQKKVGIWSIIKTYLYITILYPIVKEIKGRKRRGYIISKKEKIGIRLMIEWAILVGALSSLLFISYRCMT